MRDLSTLTRALTLRAGPLLQPGHQVGDLRRVQLERGVDLRFDHAFALVLQRLVLHANVREHVQAAVLGQHPHEILGLAA